MKLLKGLMLYTHTHKYFITKGGKLFNQLCFLKGKESEQLSTLRDGAWTMQAFLPIKKEIQPIKVTK